MVRRFDKDRRCRSTGRKNVFVSGGEHERGESVETEERERRADW